MATCELQPSHEGENIQDAVLVVGSHESDDYSTDDSDEDPTFDILEETRSRLAKIAMEKLRPQISVEIESESEEEPDCMEIKIPELDEKDGKCFENVEKLIKDGQLKKLKVDQCKVYLRKYGLRLMGNKDVLIGRIEEHLEVINGGGEKKYPPSSFVLNCKGDACTGDVVMFEQNVYDMFSIASRSATAPSCGMRIVAGRIVKESYGLAKQQHTFTVEVLWSKGQKPLPPLHPLLIKGRNLYRLKTMRQRWTNEEERRKVLQEKHQRGNAARCERENRIQQRERRKAVRAERMKEKKENNTSDERNQGKICPSKKGDAHRHPQELQQKMNSVRPDVPREQKSQNQENHHAKCSMPMTNEHRNYAPQDLKPYNYEFKDRHSVPQVLKPSNYVLRVPQISQFYPNYHQYQQPCAYPYALHQGLPLSGLNPSRVSLQEWQRQTMQRQACRFYRQGKCRFGDSCKYRHD